jgi:hypothetical protein
MGLFKMLPKTAPHTEAGVVHKWDDPETCEFESELDLDAMFPGKFERLDGKTKRGEAEDNSLDSSGVVMDRPEHKKKTVMKAKEETDVAKGKGGRTSHIVPNSEQGRRARGEDPDQEESDEEDGEEKVGKKASKASVEETDEEDFGADVTDQFHTATDKGVQVFKSEKGFTLVKDGEKVGEPLADKKKANEAVRKFKKKK